MKCIQDMLFTFIEQTVWYIG